MSGVPPYAASLRWYVRWYAGRLSGLTDDEAVAIANRECGIAGKDFARTAVVSGTLGVAVEGGSPQLRKHGAEKRAGISLHGNWPHVHIGTLEALYGRTPYYQYVMPRLKDIIGSVAAGDSLAVFNRRIHLYLTEYIQMPYMAPGEAAGRRGDEILRDLDLDLSVIDALMKVGPEINLVLWRYK